MSNLEEIDYMIKILERIDNERKQVRRILFKFIRENVDCLPDSMGKFYLRRKIRGNWLGDLRDCNIIDYTNQIYRRLNP